MDLNVKELDMGYKSEIKGKGKKKGEGGGGRVKEEWLYWWWGNIKIISRIFLYIIYKYYIWMRKLIRENFNIENMKNRKLEMGFKKGNNMVKELGDRWEDDKLKVLGNLGKIKGMVWK